MNPFKDHGDLLPITSVNRLYIDDQKAYDLFHSALIYESLLSLIKRHMNNIDTPMTLSDLMQLIESSSNQGLKDETNAIIKTYGAKLAQIIGTLFKPSEQSIINHHEWTDEHRAYWASIKTLYLAGGAIIDPFIKPFTVEIDRELKRRKLSQKVYLLAQSEDLGIKGMASLYTNQGTLLLFDLGQTSIKRAIKVNNITCDYIKLSNIPAKHLFSNDGSEQGILESAQLLHEYLLSSIIDVIKIHDITPDTLFISIANYVKKGCLQPGKNSYGKLDFIAHPYDLYLGNQLDKVLGYPIQVKLFHDTSAMALNFKNQEKTAIISVGTAFGVGFTED